MEQTQKNNPEIGGKQFPVWFVTILSIVVLWTLAPLKSFVGVFSWDVIFIFSPYLITGLQAVMITTVIATVHGFILYGLFTRKAWGRKLTIGWFLIGIAILLNNFTREMLLWLDRIHIWQNNPEKLATVKSILLQDYLFFILWLLTAAAVIFYAYRKKDFFKN